MNFMRTALAIGAFSILLSVNANALNQATHDVVNRVAAQQSSLDTILRNQLKFSDGLNQPLRGRPVVDWIGEGGVREDDGFRFFRHFHDPLRPWPDAGLDFFGRHQSSIQWMQRPTPPTSCHEWTWSSARCHFYEAMTSGRADSWVRLFRALGQLMHLVVDASVPEHARNDPHPLGGLFGSYEYWVESVHGRRGTTQETAFIAKYLATPERPDPILLEQPTGDTATPVSVAHLIDTVTYRGVAPNLTLTPRIGIAEVANANFFSEDSGYRRFLAPDYPYPSVEGLLPSTHPAPASSRVRAYYRKAAWDGLSVDPVLAECSLDAAFRDDGIPTPQYKCADANVWDQTALAMLPRAVGYAAALLDYFFRGALGASYEDETLRISGHPERMVGNFELRYQRTDGSRPLLATWALQVDPGQPSPPLAAPELPADAAPSARCWLIFRGQLGSEANAVVGSAASCPPPASAPSGQWYVYLCSTFLSELNYIYATTNPPLWEGGPNDPALVFGYRQESTGTGFSCSLLVRQAQQPPPNAMTEHPA